MDDVVVSAAFVLGVVGGCEQRRDAAMAVMRGDRSLREAAREHGLSVGQVRRAVDKVKRAAVRLDVTADGGDARSANGGA